MRETGIFLLFIEFYPIMCQNLRQLIPAGPVKIYAQIYLQALAE